MRATRGSILGWYLMSGAVALLFVVPIAWMFLTSLRSETAVMGGEAMAPLHETARANYEAVWTDEVVQFPVYLRNSLVVALLNVVGTVIGSAIAAYGFARVRWRGRGGFFLLVLLTMMVPFPVLMVPLYILFRTVGWVGTLRPLWVPAWLGIAFSIFLLRQFFLSIPRELDDAARIDGCGHIGTFRHIVLPLARPALAVVALLQFMVVWNDFLAPLIFLTHRDQFTLALGLHLYQSQQGSTPWNLLMAASTLFVLPVIVVFLLTQRAFTEGIATTGLKA